LEVHKGLEGVAVASTGLGFIDGEKGILEYRGYSAEKLAEHATFEEVVYLLWFGELPNKSQLTQFAAQLKVARVLPREVVELIKKFPTNSHPMDVLRTTISALGLYDESANDVSKESVISKAIKLTAAFPTITAAFSRVQEGKDIVSPDMSLGHAANFLYMIRGERGQKVEEKVMDVCFIVHAEHELNASAFSARVTASTLADVYGAVTSAISTLRGPLHGGANEKVLVMLNEIKSVEEVGPYILGKLERKERVMGFGHRVYKVKDPRAFILENYSERLGKEKQDLRWFLVSKKIEEIMKREVGVKGIYPNVDFYSASVYHYLGLSAGLFPSIFACSRISGWAGHLLEQYADNRLIRPASVYNGPEKREFIGIDNRG
jgi:citrate synthase